MTFTVYVCPTFIVNGCATKRDEEKRGLMGFHSFERCPACEVIPLAFDLWGENGHKQGSIPYDSTNPLALAEMIVHRMRDSRLTFKAGSTFHIVGTCNEKIGPNYGIPESED